MTTFKDAVINQTTTTTNGMKALVTSGNACTNLFFHIGAARGTDIIPKFVAAYVENEEYALRIAAWARDIRGGAGERELFRKILQYVEITDKANAIRLVNKIPELGRFDDMMVCNNADVRNHCFSIIKEAINNKNALTTKWLPREKSINKYLPSDMNKSKLSYHEKLNLLNETQFRKVKFAKDLRAYLGMSSETYRKTLASISATVETQMCAKQWDEINFSHVPSVASIRYKTAFNRNTPKYQEYVDALAAGDSSVKINAAAVYPYDVLKPIYNSYGSQLDNELAIAQWAALPNYVGNANILPMVDVSGSMTTPINNSLTCLLVAISLGLYLSDKNTGKFADMFLTFSEAPHLLLLEGNVVERLIQMTNAAWGMSTNLEAAMKLILNVAVESSIPDTEMPEYLLILSDMQFNVANRLHSDTALSMTRALFEEAGYTMPKIIFWNLHSYDNIPVQFDEAGTALVSGFSPSIMKSILSCDESKFTPIGIMETTILNPRYDL